MAFSRVHALVMVTPDDPAYENKPSDWNADHSLSGADVGGIPYCPTATTETTSANLTYSETSGPRLQVGSGSGTSGGWLIGSNQDGAGGARITPTVAGAITNSVIFANSAQANIGHWSGPLYLQAAATTKITLVGTAGAGPSITAGTATTDVNALSATQTWNASGVAFTFADWTITDTASAAGSLAFRIRGGAAGTTALLTVNKSGDVTAGQNFYLPAGGQLLSSNTRSLALESGDVAYFGGTAQPTTLRTSDCIRVTANNDIGFARNAAGVLEINSTSAGTFRDLKLRDITQTGSQSLTEMTAPTGTANVAKIFAQDNGAGKTQLMVIFGSGVAQQLAIEA